MDKPKILLGITGSVAAIKAELLIHQLSKWAEVTTIQTESSLQFVKVQNSYIHEAKWEQIGDPITHIELRRHADLLLIAPLSANTLAKICYGMCDNLLTNVVRAWDYNKPIILAPAMNTVMWNNPQTSKQISQMRKYGALCINPIIKELACGDNGIGAMADVAEISKICRNLTKMYERKKSSK